MFERFRSVLRLGVAAVLLWSGSSVWAAGTSGNAVPQRPVEEPGSAAGSTLPADASGSTAERPLPVLTGEQRWIVLASRQDLEEAKALARGWSSSLRDLHVVRARNGWFSVVSGPHERRSALDLLKMLKKAAAVPADATVSEGELYATAVWSGRNFLEALTVFEGRKPAKLVWRDLHINIDTVPGSEGGLRTPIARGFIRGRRVFTIRLDEIETPKPEAILRLLWLDRASPYPQVMLSSYWGGAHCCTVAGFADAKTRGEWRVTTTVPLDGENPSVEDLLDAGTPVVIYSDDRFLHRFGSYATSVAPPLIHEFRNGELQYVTRDPRYAPVLRRRLRETEEYANLSDPVHERNNYLAGWVAYKILLGEKEEAWAEMLKRYDRASTNGLDGCAVAFKRTCPKDKVILKAYPDALRELLEETGYLPASQGSGG